MERTFIDVQPQNRASLPCFAGSQGLSSGPREIFQTVSLGDSVNKSGPEHVLYVVQAGPNSSTQRSCGPTLFYPWTGAPRFLGAVLARVNYSRKLGEYRQSVP